MNDLLPSTTNGSAATHGALELTARPIAHHVHVSIDTADVSLRGFLAEATHVRDDLKSLTARLREIEAAADRAAKATKSGDVRGRAADLKRIVNETAVSARAVQRRLASLRSLADDAEAEAAAAAAAATETRGAAPPSDADTRRGGLASLATAWRAASHLLRRLPPPPSTDSIPAARRLSVESRMRSTVAAALTTRMREVGLEFGELRARLRRDEREAASRAFYAATGERPPPALLDTLVDGGNRREFDDAVAARLAATAKVGAEVSALRAEAAERRSAARALESSLLDLHNVFIDMSLLVEAQGGLIDDIETQVNSATGAVASGTKALSEAHAIQTGKRKWACCALICGLLLLVVLAGLTLIILKTQGVLFPSAHPAHGPTPSGPAPSKPWVAPPSPPPPPPPHAATMPGPPPLPRAPPAPAPPRPGP